MDKLQEIRARWAESAMGPWHWNGNEIVALSNPRRGIAGIPNDEPEETAQAIAAAPQDIEYLVCEVERLREAARTVYENHGHTNVCRATRPVPCHCGIDALGELLDAAQTASEGE